jgi:murein DD-endopeptidase MepM/ murein hydrolase activator NlpD
MKISLLNIIFPLFAFMLIFVPSGATIINSPDDPIQHSYIINFLEMETDIVPSPEIEEDAMGEIIYDPSFYDSRGRIIHEKKEYIKELKKEDSRWYIKKYRVRKNESLWTIARKFNVSHSMLIRVNNLPNPDMIREGTLIDIPSRDGITYRINKGDTLSGIAVKYKVNMKSIADHNDIKEGKIIAGREIFIPGAVERKTPIPADRTDRRKSEIADSSPPKETGREINKTEIKEKKVDEKIVLSWPLKGPITSGFGYRAHPLSGEKRFHSGLDIGAEEGSQVKAAGDGKVIFEGWKDIYGKMIVVAHKNNYITVYAHNSKNLVKLDDIIKRGQPIALSGKTGAVTGAHLHFEIRKGIVPLNPIRILK